MNRCEEINFKIKELGFGEKFGAREANNVIYFHYLSPGDGESLCFEMIGEKKFDRNGGVEGFITSRISIWKSAIEKLKKKK